MSSYRNPLSG